MTSSVDIPSNSSRPMLRENLRRVWRGLLVTLVVAACGGSDGGFDEEAARAWLAANRPPALAEAGVRVGRETCKLGEGALRIYLDESADNLEILDFSAQSCKGKMADALSSITCTAILADPVSTASALNRWTGLVERCRRDGFDPVWNEYGINATHGDYEGWRASR